MQGRVSSSSGSCFQLGKRSRSCSPGKASLSLPSSPESQALDLQELWGQVRGETTVKHGWLKQAAGFNLSLASSAASGGSLQLSGLVLLWKAPLPGTAVAVLPPTPASMSQGVNELQTATLITHTAPALISPLSLREISSGKGRERKKCTFPLCLEIIGLQLLHPGPKVAL